MKGKNTLLKEVISYYDKDSGSDITVIPSKTMKLQPWLILVPRFWVPNATMKNLSQFQDEFANARTFSFLHEIEML